jgi:soluble lytic murein transglycosylase
MKNKPIDNLTPTGQKLVFLFFLVAALVIAWFAASRLPIKQRADSPLDMKRVDELIAKASAKHGVSPQLIKAIIWQETKFRPNMRGKAGEIGLMQIRPETAVLEWQRGNKLSFTPTEAQLFDPETNIDIGTWYLAWTGKHWKGYKSQLILQIAEYNAGYGNARKWKPAKPETEVKLTDITIKSTRAYVENVTKKMKEY